MVDISDCALTRKQVEKLLSDCEVQSGSKAYWFKVDEKGELAGGIAKFVTDLRPQLEQVLTLAPNTLVVVAVRRSSHQVRRCTHQDLRRRLRRSHGSGALRVLLDRGFPHVRDR